MKDDIHNYLEKFEEQPSKDFLCYMNLFMKALLELLMENCGLNYHHSM